MSINIDKKILLNCWWKTTVYVLNIKETDGKESMLEEVKYALLDRCLCCKDFVLYNKGIKFCHWNIWKVTDQSILHS